MFAIPLASKPTLISRTGPTAPNVATRPTTNDLVPSLRLLNALRTFVPNSMIGVTSFRKDSPIGASAAWNCSIADLNFVAADSSTLPSSRPAIAERSLALVLIRSRTAAAWLPSSIMLLNRADILANWNLPNSLSMALDFSSGSSWSRAIPRSRTVCLRFPAFLSTIPTTSMP